MPSPAVTPCPISVAIASVKFGMHSKQMRHKDVTSVFMELGNLPETIHDYQIDVLEYFLKKIYSPATTKLSESLAKERILKFECNPDNDLRKLPMSRPGLLQHVKRSCYQAGYIWRECNENIDLPDLTLWGWCRQEGNILVPKWQDIPTIEIPPLIDTCSCKTGLCKTCKCSKAKFPCLPFCLCRRACSNWYILFGCGIEYTKIL